MKTFKTNEHSVFPRPFGINGKMYLGIGVMVYFDLTDGTVLDTEQEMWKNVPDQLGNPPILDTGIPKPHGEVLAVGSCFAPRGTSRPASKVRIRVGEVDKTINVYGNRYWQGGVITEAEPFTEMPIIWENAFGGEDFKKNPKGKGLREVGLPEGDTAVPLPNLELPDQQIGSPGDRPEPACFDQLYVEHPVRMAKCGTYDDKWKEERWPHFPDDMDYEYFNAASEDQFIGEFFKGGEPLTVENMHPDMPRIEGTLPNLRMRAFVTLNPEYDMYAFPTGPLPSQQVRETDEFREVSMRLETVWLFPNLTRGVAIYRGSTEIMDEESMDVTRMLVRHEDPAEEPGTLEHYRDLQMELLSRGVDIDMAPLEAAAKKGQDAMVRAKNVAKIVDQARQKALGNAPKMPMPQPEEMLALSRKELAAHSARLDQLEAMTKGMHAEHGHQVSIDLSIFDRVRSKMAQTGDKIEQAVTKLSAKQAELEKKRAAAVAKAAERMKAIDPKLLEKAGIDIKDKIPSPDFPFDKKVNPWHDNGFPLVVAARKIVGDAEPARKGLGKLGLKRPAIRQSWMGWNSEPVEMTPAEWGLDDETPFTIPAGLMLPRFDGSVLNRLLVFPEPTDVSKSLLVPGSDETPLFLQSATLIDLPTMPAAAGAPVVIVPDELSALFVEQEAGDCVSVLVLASPEQQPGDDAADALKGAKPVLVVMPEGWQDDKAQRQAMQAWTEAMEGAEPIELEHGGTVFDSRDQGSDIRGWIFKHLPKDYADGHSVTIPLPEPGKPPSKDFMKGFKPPIPPDVKGLVTGVISQVKQELEAKFAPLKAKQAALLQKTGDRLKSLDIKGVQIEVPDFTKPAGAIKKSPVDQADRAVKSLDRVKAKLVERKQLTPELEQKIDEAKATFKKLGADSQALKDKLEAEFAAKKQELEQGLQKLKNMEPPDKAKEVLARQGIDPDKLRALTREEAKRLHDQGQSLAGYILSRVDLSELDFTGADFTGCQIQKTNFKGATLDETVFVQALGKEADFTGASLKGANMECSVFPKAVFAKADLSGAFLKQAAFKEADFTKANLSGANLDMAVIDKITGTETNFSGASLFMSLVGGDVSGSDFKGATIRKCLFNDAVVDKADFRETTMPDTLFNGVTGEQVTFAGANLDRFRTGNNTVLRGADFTGVSMRDGTLRDSDLTEAKFTGAALHRVIIEAVQLVRADLNRVVGPGARFQKSNLEGATVRGANLYTSSMRKSRLVDADLRGSNFYATNFYKAVLGNTRFEGTNLVKSLLHKRVELLDDDS